MNTYLLTWNPERWNWKDINDEILEIRTSGSKESGWSTGNNKSILNGDRFFLCKLGVNPKGIIGSGFVSSIVYPGEHWDKKKKEQGIIANYVDIVFDVLSENPLITENELNNLPKFNWFPYSSGINIPDDISLPLENLWSTKTKSSNPNYLIESSEIFKEGKRILKTSVYYERNYYARQKCLEYKGYSCIVCTFNFESKYGNIGKNFIHVHHIKPISEIQNEYNIDPKEDLVPLCPNCHSMIHRTTPAISIEELIKIIHDATASNSQ